MSSNTNILDNECILKNGEHDYESINSQYISKNIIEVEVICLDCGHLDYVYNYIEEDDNYDF